MLPGPQLEPRGQCGGAQISRAPTCVPRGSTFRSQQLRLAPPVQDDAYPQGARTRRLGREVHVDDERRFTRALKSVLGLGCGARSYTTSVHYSEEWAVATKSVRDILQSYIARGETDFASARYGFVLNADEQLRRHALLLLLTREGLDESAFYQRFHCSIESAIDSARPMIDAGLIERRGQHLTLTERGLALSDWVGPRLFSPDVRRLMTEYSLR